MDVNIRSVDPSLQINNIKGTTQNSNAAPSGNVVNKAQEVAVEAAIKDAKEAFKFNLTKDDAQILTADMNKYFQSLNANLRFAYHEKTSQLMLRVVDASNDKVLKEIPSHEVLDMLAKVREYVGALLDKKA